MALSLPKGAEGRLFEGFGTTSERDGGRRMYVGYPGGYLFEDLVNVKGSMRHDGGAGRSFVDRLRGGRTLFNATSMHSGWKGKIVVAEQVLKFDRDAARSCALTLTIAHNRTEFPMSRA